MKTLINNIMEKFEKFKLYRRTHRELSSLTDYELSDIGISRYDIPRIAREVYYR